MRKNLFLLLIFSALLYSCAKTADQTRPINPDLLKYFSYKPGTYWVYKDSIAGEVDSFFVSNNTKSIDAGPPDYYVNNISIFQIKESNMGSDTVFWYMSIIENAASYWSKGLSGNVDRAYAPLFIYPFQNKINTAQSTSFKNVDMTNIFPSYVTGDKTFNTVEEIHYYGFNYDDWYYINTDVGIVKMRWSDTANINNKVWELQRWNIVR